jgi:uncharacterized protein (DUF433 family)
VESGKKTLETYIDRREKPIYTVEEAAHYLAIPASTLSTWALGREKSATEESYPPTLEHVDRYRRQLSFFDLVEAHILRATTEKRLPLRRVKQGLALLKQYYPTLDRPLLSLQFLTEGKNLLVRGLLQDESAQGGKLTNLSVHGQIEMEKLIEEHLQLISRDALGMPYILYPKTGSGKVSMTPGLLSGRPVIDNTRIPTAVVAQRFKAGESPDELAADYKLSREAIEAALRYEKAA